MIEGSGILARGWRLRLWAPFLSSLMTSSSFCPSSVFRESLGHSLSSGRPFYPSHPGLPCCPGILGLWAGANSRRSLFGRRSDGTPYLSPRQGKLPSDRERSRSTTPPHPGGHDAAVPRRLSSVLPIPLPAPPGFCPRDWETVAANLGGPVSHEDTRLGAFVGE